MGEQATPAQESGFGLVAGEVSERGEAVGGCCGLSPVALDSGGGQRAAPCCGSAAASAQGACCESAAKAEAVASGASCCG